MIDPILKLTLFKMRTKKALKKLSYTGSIYGITAEEKMEDALRDLIQHCRDEKDEFYWSFASYARNHTKSDILEISAIPLEFPYELASEIVEAQETFPHIHYIIHSQDEINSKRPQERLVVLTPLAKPITCPKEYTRIASLLSEQLGVAEHSKGDFSSTFLFAPFLQVCSMPKIVLHDTDRTFLDPDAYLKENKGVWTNARLMQEGAAAQPKLKADETGLFMF
ncbi:hypothetical protein ACKU27_03005 [Sphingobium yanoikuyae]|jgi:hypothetical protein|uniref:hypothetical protein n=1 Tax=Sphingobium yanoikuyae TaxID=13690 RepID=UPI0028B1DA54|nr:hypothetical protein [Sphingobium yanoikuyae]